MGMPTSHRKGTADHWEKNGRCIDF